MTIKQVLIGTLVGSSIVGVMVHRVHSEKNLQQHTLHIVSPKIARHEENHHKVASLKRTPWLKKGHTKTTELSSQRLYS